jgi:uncharacterized protein involved in exopolysaccharide biosynthesis
LTPIGPAATPAAAASTRFTPLDPLRILRQYARLLVVVGVIGLGIGVAAYFLLKHYVPEYSSTATLVVTGGVKSSTEETSGMTRGSAEMLGTLIQNQLVLLEGDDVLEEVLTTSEVKATQWYQSLKDNPVALKKSLREQLTVGNRPRTTLINVSFESKNPADLYPIVNKVIEVYLRLYVSGLTKNTELVRRVWYEEQQRTIDEISRIQEDLRTFATDHDLATLDPSHNDAMIAYGELAAQLARYEPEYQSIRQAYEKLVEQQKSGQIVPSPEKMAAIQQVASVQSRDERLRALREQREILLNRFGESHARV